MRINQVEDKKVNVTLNSDELVTLTNVMYFYEKHYKEENNAKELNATFHDLNAQIITASNLCQYGHLDDFALNCVLKEKIAANPNSRLAKALNLSVLENENGGV